MSKRNCPIQKCECGHTDFVFHYSRKGRNHWHCRKCRKEYDHPVEIDNKWQSEAAFQLGMYEK